VLGVLVCGVGVSECDESVEIVGGWASLEVETIGLEVDEGLSVTLNNAMHVRSGREGNGKFRCTSRDVEGLGIAIECGEENCGVGLGGHVDPEGILENLKVGGLANGIRSIGILGMGTGPHIELILADGRVVAGLESGSIIFGHIKPSRVVETVNPSLRVGLSSLNGGDVMRLAVVIPSEEFDQVNLVAVFDDGLPAGSVQMIITVVNPVLVVGVGTVMSEEPRADSSHISLGTTRNNRIQSIEVLSVSIG